MRFENVVFDLDGTLVDSLAGIEASSRHAVGLCMPELVLPPMRGLVGPPIAKMFEALWPELSAAEIKRVVAAFREHYDAEGCLLSQLYPGVEKTLRELHSRGAKLFVLTNKPLQASRLILQHRDVLPLFRDVVSPDVQAPALATKSDGAKLLQAKHKLDASKTVIVGDGQDDGEAAEACGFSFLIASYGYGSAAREANGSHHPSVKTFPSILDTVL